MNILHFIHHTHGGGAQAVCRQIQEALGGQIVDAEKLQSLGWSLQQYREAVGCQVVIIHYGAHVHEDRYFVGLKAPCLVYCHTTWRDVPDIPGMVKMAPSNYVGEKFRAWVVPPCLPVYTPHAPNRTGEGKLKVGFHSRFDEKLHHDWPEHFEKMHQLFGELIELHVAGDGKFKEAWKRRAPSIHWHDWLEGDEAKYAFLDSLDIFAYPTRDESFGLCILEAMRRQLPVVTFYVGGISDLVENHVTGYLANNWEEFENWVLTLVNQRKKRDRFGLAGVNKSYKFKPESMRRRMEEMLKHLLPEVLTVIPTFDRPALMLRAAASSWRQGYPQHEAIMVRDGGSDVTYPRNGSIYFYRFHKNMGLSGTRNKGIERGLINFPDTQFITFLDDDDQFVGHTAQSLVEPMLIDPEIGVTYGRMVAEHEGQRYTMPQYRHFDFNEMLTRGLMLSPSCAMFRVSVLKKHGFWDEAMHQDGMLGPEDVEMWVRLAKAGVKFHFVDQVLTRYTAVTQDSLTTKSYQTGAHRKGFAYIEEKHDVSIPWGHNT